MNDRYIKFKKQIKAAFKAAIAMLICFIICVIIANKSKEYAYAALFIGGILAEKVGSFIEGE